MEGSKKDHESDLNGGRGLELDATASCGSILVPQGCEKSHKVAPFVVAADLYALRLAPGWGSNDCHQAGWSVRLKDADEGLLRLEHRARGDDDLDGPRRPLAAV